MKRYLSTIQYVGKNYCGFQMQENGISIQEVIENSLEKLFNKHIEIFASGRTDAGVNALGQTIHFDVDTTIPAEKIPLAINPLLPVDIKFVSTKEVSKNFNARFDVKKKTYLYDIYISPVELPVYELFAYHQKKQPDISLMKQCASVLVGKHDFRAFMSAGAQSKTFERTIFKISIKQSKNLISIEVCGNGFLYNMVRIIVGTLLEVGYRKKTSEQISLALKSLNRSKTGYLVPAKALFLKNVKY